MWDAWFNNPAQNTLSRAFYSSSNVNSLPRLSSYVLALSIEALTGNGCGSSDSLA